MIKIDPDKCVGCGLCVKTCPFSSITMSNRKAEVLPFCTSCGLCIDACKFGAITLDQTVVTGINESLDHSGIWVFAQHSDDLIKSVVFELLGLARTLAEQKKASVTAIIPEGTSQFADELISYGADHVIILKDCLPYNDEACANAVSSLARELKPEILLIGATVLGRSLAPRISCLLNTGLTADCTGLEIDSISGLLIQTRPAFGGNLMASIVCPAHRPQMATVRPHVFPIPEKDDIRTGKVTIVDAGADTKEITIHLLEHLKNPSDTLNIQDAEIIIAVGKGIGSIENIQRVELLASKIGGVVAATRAVVDSGWLTYPRQVGQTGKTISPKLYIALGISGAIQHTVGVANVDCLIAVNTDPMAPIFKIADHGVVADCNEIVQNLLGSFKE